jgi:hypothetical protein
MIAMAQKLCAPARGVNAYARVICNPANRNPEPSAAHRRMANQIMISFTMKGTSALSEGARR